MHQTLGQICREALLPALCFLVMVGQVTATQEQGLGGTGLELHGVGKGRRVVW